MIGNHDCSNIAILISAPLSLSAFLPISASMTEVNICSFYVPEEKPMEVEEEEEDDQKNPGNLLDNLFRKTKTTPCLYWLPLTDEQVCKTPTPTPLPHVLHVISHAFPPLPASPISPVARVLQTKVTGTCKIKLNYGPQWHPRLRLPLVSDYLSTAISFPNTKSFQVKTLFWNLL